MVKINIEERKKLQLDILDEIHRFCVENNINYSLGYGTLLGAIRHKGYIPWDDDIDIVMLRKDYDKFISSFATQIYKVASTTTIDNWFLPFAKVYDDRTLIIDRKANTTSIGLNVDVFPIDDAMDSEKEFNIQRKYINYLTTCNRVKLFKLNKETKFFNNVIVFLAKCSIFFFPKFYFTKRLINVSQKYNGKGYSKAVYWASIGKTIYLDKNIYKRFTELEFEGKFYFAIKDFDTYLTNIYGDYMKLPPEEKRISYHTSDAYWK